MFPKCCVSKGKVAGLHGTFWIDHFINLIINFQYHCAALWVSFYIILIHFILFYRLPIALSPVPDCVLAMLLTAAGWDQRRRGKKGSTDQPLKLWHTKGKSRMKSFKAITLPEKVEFYPQPFISPPVILLFALPWQLSRRRPGMPASCSMNLRFRSLPLAATSQKSGLVMLGVFYGWNWKLWLDWACRLQNLNKKRSTLPVLSPNLDGHASWSYSWQLLKFLTSYLHPSVKRDLKADFCTC